jgi:D-3-phosphoglycerate dehydrogenase
MTRILVADAIAEQGLARLRETPAVAFDVKPGLTPAELADLVGQYDGLIIRSGVRVTGEMLSRPGRLRAIARAGVGVDNVDLDAATRAGVLVLNTPDANTRSTAEHTFALLLALSRHVPQAAAELKTGAATGKERWAQTRGAFQGTQLAGKTLGIIGFGRVGRAVASRALAFEMRVLAFDPFVQEDEPLEGRVTLVRSLDDLLAAADYLTIHAALNEHTRGLLGAAELAMLRRGARVVNCARGGIIDESALAEAVRGGRVAGAAVDVFDTEPPPPDHPLLALPQVICTPHLGASTAEAQQAVAVEAVDALLGFLLRGEIRGACNVIGLPAEMTRRDRAYADLAARMGALLSVLCERGVTHVTLTTHGESLSPLAGALLRFGTSALLSPYFTERLNVVNVEPIARQRGITVRHDSRPASRGPTDRLELAVEGGGESHRVEGTVFVDGLPRVLAVDDYAMNLVPAGPMLLIFNDDRPGVIGFVGTTLGNEGINVADMALSRHAGRALMTLRLDTAPPPAAVSALAAGASILRVHAAALPPMPAPVQGDTD